MFSEVINTFDCCEFNNAKKGNDVRTINVHSIDADDIAKHPELADEPEVIIAFQQRMGTNGPCFGMTKDLACEIAQSLFKTSGRDLIAELEAIKKQSDEFRYVLEGMGIIDEAYMEAKAEVDSRVNDPACPTIRGDDLLPGVTPLSDDYDNRRQD